MRGQAEMADETKDTEPEETEPNQEPNPGDDDGDVLLFALASALVPIFFRRRR
jgi:hypothetical protein